MSPVQENVMTAYEVAYKKGLRAEERVIEFLIASGDFGTVEKSEIVDDMTKDIDVWLDGESVSIKCQQAGEKYRQFCFEVGSQRYTGPCLTKDQVQWLRDRKGDSPRFNLSPKWRSSWFQQGDADTYIIWQGPTLYLFRKEALMEVLEAEGFGKMRTLSKALLASQDGKDTCCGYLDRRKVPVFKTYEIGLPE